MYIEGVFFFATKLQSLKSKDKIYILLTEFFHRLFSTLTKQVLLFLYVVASQLRLGLGTHLVFVMVFGGYTHGMG